MSPSLTSLRDAWVETTSFDSTGLQLIVIAVTAVCGAAVTWMLTEAWERLFGYSSAVTALVTFAVFFSLYASLSYAVTRVRAAD